MPLFAEMTLHSKTKAEDSGHIQHCRPKIDAINVYALMRMIKTAQRFYIHRGAYRSYM